MPDAREELTAALAAQAAAERRLHRAVHRARQEGWSWAEVAETLGVSRQAAHRRFHAAAGSEGLTPDDDVAPWWGQARDVGGSAARAWFAGDLASVHAAMTATARSALPETALRRVLLELEDLAGRCAAPVVTGVHDLDGGPLPEAEAAAVASRGRHRAVVVRCVAAGEHADPVVHVLVGPSGRVSGISVRLADALEVWPL